jgi:phosphoribosylformylglycinamidine synthase PurS subunit
MYSGIDSTPGASMVTAEIRIELKPGVADPEGANTKKALELLGFEGIKAVRTMKVFEMDLDMPPGQAKTRCEEMCRKLLANPVIQKYRILLK